MVFMTVDRFSSTLAILDAEELIATSYAYMQQLPDVFRKSAVNMLYRVGARTDAWAGSFFSLENRLFCPSLVNKVKDLVYSNSIMKLARWLEVSICCSFTRKP